MIGSPNYVRFVYDGDGSAFDARRARRVGVRSRRCSSDFYADRGLAFEPTQIDFRSDYSAFFEYDIPFGGVFTGAEGIKTAEQVAVYGGTAGQQYDPCYHAACDTFANNSDAVLDLNSDADRPRDADVRDEHRDGDARSHAAALALSARASGASRGHQLVAD